jgi:hypothetical protein
MLVITHARACAPKNRRHRVGGCGAVRRWGGIARGCISCRCFPRLRGTVALGGGEMATRTMKIELSGAQREDGCYHLKSADLPGFHFIIGPDEKEADFETALKDALLTFVPRHLAAKAREQRDGPALKITRTRSALT